MRVLLCGSTGCHGVVDEEYKASKYKVARLEVTDLKPDKRGCAVQASCNGKVLYDWLVWQLVLRRLLQ